KQSVIDKEKEEEEYQLALALSLSAQEAEKKTKHQSYTASFEPAKPAVKKVLFQVRALYDFPGVDEGELPLHRDDIVDVYDSTTFKDWWKGECHSKIGIFPSNYVEQIETKPTPVSTPGSISTSGKVTGITVDVLLATETPKVDEFIMLLATIDPRKDNLSENDKLQERYHDMILLRPKLLKLIEGYRQKQDELVQLNDRFTKAATSYHRMSEASIVHMKSFQKPPPATYGYANVPPQQYTQQQPAYQQGYQTQIPQQPQAYYSNVDQAAYVPAPPQQFQQAPPQGFGYPQ
ncbi:ESCRT-0 subunit protein hse1, partial [Nowakowskiella sp. JEL0078]